jgi:hypothetical protein
MTELQADFSIFKDPAFLMALALCCAVLLCIGGVIWYVQS